MPVLHPFAAVHNLSPSHRQAGINRLFVPGMALVDAHGSSEAQAMLPLFESYLERQVVENEELYDRIRQAAVVFLGTLARHMDPGSAKVRYGPFVLSNQSWISRIFLRLEEAHPDTSCRKETIRKFVAIQSCKQQQASSTNSNTNSSK